MSYNLMNINPEAYKHKRSNAPSRSMWLLNDIIPIIYTHNVYSDGKPRISSFQLYTVSEDPSSYA